MLSSRISTMPRLGGIALCERTLGVRPDLPVIVVTGHGRWRRRLRDARGRLRLRDQAHRADCSAARDSARARQELREDMKRPRERATEMGGGDASGTSAAMRASTDDRSGRGQRSVGPHPRRDRHRQGARRARAPRRERQEGAFVALNCAAVPREPARERALRPRARRVHRRQARRTGLFVEANGGTLFLDEIGELPLEIQPKLLRALQERKVRPVGSNAEMPFDARLVARDEPRSRARGRREALPRGPLLSHQRDQDRAAAAARARRRRRSSSRPSSSERREAQRQAGARSSRRPRRRSCSRTSGRATCASWRTASSAPWSLARHEEVVVDDLPEKVRQYADHRIVISTDDTSEIVTMDEIERRYFLRVLAAAGGNKVRAARLLGVDREDALSKAQEVRKRGQAELRSGLSDRAPSSSFANAA